VLFSGNAIATALYWSNNLNEPYGKDPRSCEPERRGRKNHDRDQSRDVACDGGATRVARRSGSTGESHQRGWSQGSSGSRGNDLPGSDLGGRGCLAVCPETNNSGAV